MKLAILKIGGSVLTEKRVKGRLKVKEIRRISREIACNPRDLILVHGAGSFGHPQARAYGLSEGLMDENFKGVFITHRAVRELNELFVDALIEQGIEAIPMHPLSCATLSSGRIASFDLTVIRAMLRRNILPVLHGDVVIDVKKGAGILSGDQIVVYLAEQLKAKKIGLGTDVEGVLDRKGNLIQEITPGSFGSVRKLLEGSKGVDVTGGMLSKVDELIGLARAGISSRIFNAAKKGNVEAFLSGEDNFGTLIRGG